MQKSDNFLRSTLEQARTIAVIGAKDAPGQAVDTVGHYLIAAGYKVIPVHPVREQVWGLTTYKTVGDIPEQIDIVDVFRGEAFCPEHAREVLALAHKPKVFWMQLGIKNEEARLMLEEQGIPVVQDACIKIEHHRLFG